MKASTVPTQARKVVKTFLSAIEYARALRDNNDENRGKIVGLTALMAFKNHDSDGAVSAAQLEFVPE